MGLIMLVFTTMSGEDVAATGLIAKWATADDFAQSMLRKTTERQRDFVLTRSLLRALLKKTTDDDVWQIHSDPNGRPRAITLNGTAAPYISLSHTPGLVACAVSLDGSIGIDVESWRERDFVALAQYAFGQLEREEISQNGISAFYRIWTLREAIAKAAGNGIFSTFDGRDYAANAPVTGCWISGEWKLFHTSPHPKYSLALAYKNGNKVSDTLPIMIDAGTLWEPPAG